MNIMIMKIHKRAKMEAILKLLIVINFTSQNGMFVYWLFKICGGV